MPLRITRSIVPNLFTLANLFCGFSAIVMFSQSRWSEGILLIVLAGVFDMLDGYMARLTKSASELGVELDSLCDAVSFGVAPSFLLYQVFFKFVDDTGILISALPAMAGVYRLARFNAQLTSLEDKQYFRGMPIPAGALTIISFVQFYVLPESIGLSDFISYPIDTPLPIHNLSVYIVTIATSLVMVSTIKYPNLPRPSAKNFKQNPIFYSFFVVSFIGTILTKGLLLFPSMALYLVAGAIAYGISLVREKQEIEVNELDDDDEEEELD